MGFAAAVGAPEEEVEVDLEVGVPRVPGGPAIVFLFVVGICCFISAQKQICDQGERRQNSVGADVLVVNVVLVLRFRERGDPRWFILNRGGPEISNSK